MFADLVKRGCQPDMLALSFHEVVDSETRGLQQHQHVRDELDRIERLGAAARAALSALVNRQRQFDKYLSKERLRVADPEVETLALVCEDLEQVLASQQADMRR